MALTVTGPINISYSGGAAGPATTTQSALAAGFVVPTLPVGGSATFSAPVSITGAVVQSNTATVATPTGITDPTPSNNAATATTVPLAPGCCLTYGNVVVSPNPVPAGTNFTVSARVTEVCGVPAGGGGLANLTGLPAAITGESGQTWPGLPSIGFHVLSWGLTNTSSAALSVNANVHTSYPNDSCPADLPFSFNTATPVADMSVTKNISPATFTSGGTTAGTVTLVATNNGPNAANGAILTDNIV